MISPGMTTHGRVKGPSPRRKSSRASMASPASPKVRAAPLSFRSIGAMRRQFCGRRVMTLADRMDIASNATPAAPVTISSKEAASSPISRDRRASKGLTRRGRPHQRNTVSRKKS